MKISLLNEFGDFQTPTALVKEVAEHLTKNGCVWERILEPTCGVGRFISSFASRVPASGHIQGIELQERYVHAARQATATSEVRTDIYNANIFDVDVNDLQWNSSGKLLVVGNPPWVTNSSLGSIESKNLPIKENFKGLSGFDAMTGGSNFDIAEYIWLKLIRDLMKERPTIALLCKTSVARNVLTYAHINKWPVVSSSIHRIDAKKWFSAAVDAGLFTIEIGDASPNYSCPVFPNVDSVVPETIMGFSESRLIADFGAYQRGANVDGECEFIWRQGVKHDAVATMELQYDGTAYKNKTGEIVEVEANFVYPLFKSSDLSKESLPSPRRSIIVPQRYVGQETAFLQNEAPKLWNYLTAHLEHFNRRRSSIYIDQPLFSIFGIGKYSFAPYKVVVAGMSKHPKFWPVGPKNGQPIMLDDTCYFVPCHTWEQAELLSSLLNSSVCLDLLKSLIFSDSKRPITKKLLQRINVMKILDLSSHIYDVKKAEAVLSPLIMPPH